MKIKKSKKWALLQTLIALTLSTGAGAQVVKTSQVEKPKRIEISLRPTSYVSPGGLIRIKCRSERLYDLCGPSREPLKRQSHGWMQPRSRSGQGFKLFQIASLFIDSLEVGGWGDWKFKISIDIQ